MHFYGAGIHIGCRSSAHSPVDAAGRSIMGAQCASHCLRWKQRTVP